MSLKTVRTVARNQTIVRIRPELIDTCTYRVSFRGGEGGKSKVSVCKGGGQWILLISAR